MIDKEKHNPALRAIQDLIIEARSLAYRSTPSEELADFLDGVE